MRGQRKNGQEYGRTTPEFFFIKCKGAGMVAFNKLQPGVLPALTKMWQHNGEVLGMDEAGDLAVVARIIDNDTGAGNTNPRPKRAPRKKKEGVPKSPPEE